MLTLPGQNASSARSRRRERRLWHDDARHSASLGRTRCPDRGVCGGLQIDRGIFDCTALCCGKPDLCDAVCRNRPDDFARRVREVGGFSLDDVPRGPVLTAPELPSVVPTIFHGDSRTASFDDSEAVCLPLYKVIHRHDRSIRYATRRDLADGFRIAPGSQSARVPALPFRGPCASHRRHQSEPDDGQAWPKGSTGRLLCQHKLPCAAATTEFLSARFNTSRSASLVSIKKHDSLIACCLSRRDSALLDGCCRRS
jgi:hypothetical protein